jgi:hypothetical protein
MSYYENESASYLGKEKMSREDKSLLIFAAIWVSLIALRLARVI